MPRTHGTEIVKAKGKSDFPTIERFISSELDKYTGLKINFNRSHLDYAATIINNELELEGDASLDGNDFFKLSLKHLQLKRELLKGPTVVHDRLFTEKVKVNVKLKVKEKRYKEKAKNLNELVQGVKRKTIKRTLLLG